MKKTKIRKNINKKSAAVIFLFVFLILIFGCTTNNPETKNYNVIFIAFDGLQAKHLHSYGYSLNTTPNLDKFLDKSYLFTNAVSPAPWTVPAFMSVFTSMYPSEHKVVNKFIVNDKSQNKLEKANLKN